MDPGDIKQVWFRSPARFRQRQEDRARMGSELSGPTLGAAQPKRTEGTPLESCTLSRYPLLGGPSVDSDVIPVTPVTTAKKVEV